MSDSPDRLQSILQRPDEQRLREYRYRCAQAAVFGAPVIALQCFGLKLGGVEAARWVTVLQALLTGWILYIGVTGMFFEGLILLPRRGVSADLLISLAAMVMYSASVVAALIRALFARQPGLRLFHFVVVLIVSWTALRWWQWARRLWLSSRVQPSEPA
jgi:cation transport ATPase